MTRPLYRWRVIHPDHGTIEVVAPIGNEVTKAAAIAWGVDWESLKFTSRFIRLGEAEE